MRSKLNKLQVEVLESCSRLYCNILLYITEHWKARVQIQTALHYTARATTILYQGFYASLSIIHTKEIENQTLIWHDFYNNATNIIIIIIIIIIIDMKFKFSQDTKFLWHARCPAYVDFHSPHTAHRLDYGSPHRTSSAYHMIICRQFQIHFSL